MDFSLTTLIVAQSGTLASSGSTQNLTAAQVGVFNPDYTVATVGTIASKPYIYIAQGRIEQIPGLGTKKSDKIDKNKVIEFYKVTAIQNNSVQVTQVGSWTLECDQEITFTFVLHSSYIDTGFFNGLTKSIVVKTPCCSCGGNPCASVTDQALQDFVDQVVAKINLRTVPTGPIVMGQDLGRFITASRLGTGANSTLIITGNALDVYGNPCEFDAFPYEYDRMWFRTFVTDGPFTTQDFEVWDSCDLSATATILQRATYLTGTAAEIQQLEKNLYSYQTSQFKSTYKNNAWNQAFTSYVNTTFYDTYYLKYRAYDDYENIWNPGVPQDETVILAFPTGTGGAFETLVAPFLGTPTDQSGTNPTTTTTTSTTSTSTTSTTTLMP